MTTSESGLRHTSHGTAYLIPGLVLPYEEPEWNEANLLLPSFGLKGLTLLYGERNTRLLAFPIAVWRVNPPEAEELAGLPSWTNPASREAFFLECSRRQGLVGPLVVVDPAGVVRREYPQCQFAGLKIQRRRYDAMHAHNAACVAMFLEIAT